MNDNIDTLIERFYTLLHWQLAAQLPRPGGIHIYSTGATIKGFTTEKTATGYQMTISKDIYYGDFMLGFNSNGTKRKARGPLEQINFKILDNAIDQVIKIMGSIEGVIINDKRFN